MPNLDDFVQYLESNQGHTVKIITEDDYGPAEGQRRAINIRNWLVNNYQTLGIRYVLLIGNPDPDDPSNAADSYGDIPMMMCWPLNEIEEDYVIEDILIPAGFNYYYVLYESYYYDEDPVPKTAPYFSAALNRGNVIDEWKNGYGLVFWVGSW